MADGPQQQQSLRPLAVLRYHADPPLGARLVEEGRVLLGLSNSEFAARLGCSQGYATKLRRGDKPVTRAILVRLGRLLAGAA